MAKHVTTSCAEGFASTSAIGDYEIEIDATGESAPDTLDQLLAAYAACYVPALRVGAEQRDVGELGAIEIDVTGELNESDKLAGVAFDIRVDADLEDDEVAAVRERAFELCKVHDALKPELAAEVTID